MYSFVIESKFVCFETAMDCPFPSNLQCFTKENMQTIVSKFKAFNHITYLDNVN